MNQSSPTPIDSPLIHQTFALADAARAHELMESSTHIGKIMLRMG